MDQIDQTIMESEYSTIIAMESYLEKQMIMSTYVMEDGEQQQLKGVNAFEQFFNFITRTIRIVKAKIAGFISNKILEKLKKKVNNSQNTDFAISKKEYAQVMFIYETLMDSSADPLRRIHAPFSDETNVEKSYTDLKIMIKKIGWDNIDSTFNENEINSDRFKDHQSMADKLSKENMIRWIDAVKKIVELNQEICEDINSAVKEEKEELGKKPFDWEKKESQWVIKYMSLLSKFAYKSMIGITNMANRVLKESIKNAKT